ncbi:MAG: CoA transferase [Acidimicrobiales bacterium]
MVDIDPLITPGPLDGLRVVEIAGGIPAAYCARMLRGFGADTVRIEGPAVTPPGGTPGPTGVDGLDGDQTTFLVAGARRVAPDGSTAARWCAAADVIVTDRLPAELSHLGIDPGDFGPATGRLLITATPFGATGPWAGRRTTAGVQFAVGPIMGLTGDDHRAPLITGGSQAYFFGGLQAFAAATVALVGVRRRGQGAWLDLSLQEEAASIPELYAPMSEYETREPVVRSGNTVRAVWGVHACIDGYAGVCCLDRQVPALFGLIGEPVEGEPRFTDPLARMDNDDELLAYVMMFMADHTKDELLELGAKHRVPFGAVRTPRELLSDPTFAERGFFDRVRVPGPDGAGPDEVVMPGRPFPGLGWRGPDRLEPDPTEGRADEGWRAEGWTTGAAAGLARPEPVPARPLEGVRVVDLTMMWAGPYATKLMVETGADVIKVESPTAWDNIRTLVPQDPEISDPWNSAYYFNEYNHSKRSLILDLADPEGRAALLRVVTTADVVIENYRADVLDKLGLGYEVLRAARDDIILVSMAGFGKSGELRDHVGFGPIIEMMSGLMSLSGYGDDGVPYKTGVSYGDPVGGLNATAAVALALLRRDRTGEGCHIDLAQRETAALLAGPAFVAASLRGEEPVHHGNRHPVHAPHGCYPAAGDDAWVVIGARTEAEWRALAGVIGHPDLADWDRDRRRAGHDELDAAIGAWTAGRAPGELVAELQAKGVPAGAVADTLAVYDDPQLNDRGFYRVLEAEKMRPYRQTGPTWRMVGLPPHPMRRAPWFGEHTLEILTGVGFSPDEVADLVRRGVSGDAPVNPGVG